MKILYCSLSLWLLSTVALKAQVIMFPYEENFAWQVKQIDEFMERFNNSDYTTLKRYLKEHYDIRDVERVDLLRSLFNFEKTNWEESQIIQFLDQVTQQEDPPYLSFYDRDWYAGLECKGMYKNQPQTFRLTLSVEVNERTGASKWVINSVDADFLPEVDSLAMVSSLEYMPPAKSGKSIKPSSYGTDFMALVEALEDTTSFSNYIDWQQISSPLISFFDELASHNLVFQQVNHITYHFLQVPGWIFQVEDFPRQSNNSGWLISQLIEADEAGKLDYRQKQLFLQP